MIKALSLLIPFAIVSAAVALALYARPRAYQVFKQVKAPSEAVPATTTNSTASITGRVVWNGELPKVPKIGGMVGGVGRGPQWEQIDNPAEPRIDPENRGIRGGVVFLKRVGSERKPYAFPPLRIEIGETGIAMTQGDVSTAIGLIRRGDTMEIAPRSASYQMIRARGAEFFTFPVWDPAGLPRLAILGGAAAAALPPAASDRVVKHAFDQPGHIAFSSGTGNFWCQADAFVCEHPYYAVTDQSGGFSMSQVPPGEYEIVGWLKNWNVLGRDHDPETGKIMRLNYDKPYTVTKRIAVIEGQTTNVKLTLP